MATSDELLGTVADDQLLVLLQLPLAGFASQEALPARACVAAQTMSSASPTLRKLAHLVQAVMWEPWRT